ncbi:MAG: hypothetical protein ABJG42_24110 [Vibrio splendidus]
MANIKYPKLTEKPDRAKYSVSSEDPSQKNEMDAGYVSSRPKFLRKPRKTFKFGYTALNDADYKKLQAFWDEVRGGSEMFVYNDFLSGVQFNVRFKGEQFSGKFVGRGITKLWDVSGITLEEV